MPRQTLYECEERFDCPTCLEKAGSMCRTSGPRATTKEPHRGRIYRWYEGLQKTGEIKCYVL